MEIASQPPLQVNLVHVHQQLQHDEESSLDSGVTDHFSLDLSCEYPRDDETDTKQQGPRKRLDKQTVVTITKRETCATPVKQLADQRRAPSTSASPYFTPSRHTPVSFMGMSTIWISGLHSRNRTKALTYPDDNLPKKPNLDPDEELERQALQIRSALRDTEMKEVALLAERAAESGQEKFAGHASTFGHDDLDKPNMCRSSTYSEGTKPPRQRRLRLSQVRRRKKLPVLALRPIDEVVPPLQTLHHHLGAHLFSNGVDIDFSTVDMPINYHVEPLSDDRKSSKEPDDHAEPKMTFLQKVTNWVSRSKTDDTSLDHDLIDDNDNDNERSCYDVGDMLSEHITNPVVSSSDWKPLPIRIPPGLIIPEEKETSMEMILPRVISTPVLSERNEQYDQSLETAPTSSSSSEPVREPKNEDFAVSTVQAEPTILQSELKREVSALTPIALFDGEESIADKDRTPDFGPANRTDIPRTPLGVISGGVKSADLNALNLPHLFLTPVRLRGIRDRKSRHCFSTGQRSQAWNYTVSGDVPLGSDNATNNSRFRSDTFGEVFLQESARSDSNLSFDVNSIATTPPGKIPLKPRGNSMSRLCAGTTAESPGKQDNSIVDDVSPQEGLTIGQIVDKVPGSISAEEHSLQLSRSGSFSDESSRPRRPEPMSPPEARRQYDEEIIVPFSADDKIEEAWLSLERRRRAETGALMQEGEKEMSLCEESNSFGAALQTKETPQEASQPVPQLPLATAVSIGKGKEVGMNHEELLEKATKKFERIPHAGIKSERVPHASNPDVGRSCPQACGCGLELTRSASTNGSGVSVSKSKPENGPSLGDKSRQLRRVLSCPSLVDASEFHQGSCPSISDGFAVGENLRALSPSSLSPQNRKSNDRTLHSASFINVFDRISPKSAATRTRTPKPTQKDNHAFLTNYLYCSKTPQEIKSKKISESSVCGGGGISHCSDDMLLSGCEGLASVIEAARYVIPGSSSRRRRAHEKDLISFDNGEYSNTAESWFDAATERFDGAIERFVGKGKGKSECKWNGLLDAPSLSMKTPNGSRQKSLDPAKIKGIVLVSQRRPADYNGIRLSEEQFQELYGVSAQTFRDLPMRERRRLRDEVMAIREGRLRDTVGRSGQDKSKHRRSVSTSMIDLSLPKMD